MIDTTSLIAEVRENLRRLDNCPRHRFPARGTTYRLRERLTCEACGGQMDITDVGHYVRGYVAAGGPAADVMPDWKEDR